MTKDDLKEIAKTQIVELSEYIKKYSGAMKASEYAQLHNQLLVCIRDYNDHFFRDAFVPECQDRMAEIGCTTGVSLTSL